MTQHHVMTRRDLIECGFAAAAAITLAACGGAAPTPTAGAIATTTGTGAGSAAPTVVTGAGAATSAGVVRQPKRGGTLKLTQPIPIAPFEFQQFGPHTTFLVVSVFDALVRYDEKLQLQPRLAESWQWNADNTELTLKLRKGVLYHTGREFTSSDVAFNLDRVKDPKVASQFRGNVMQIKETTTPDPATVVLKFDKPYLAIFDMLTRLVMLDTATAANLEGAKQVIGTGPFKWSEYVPGNKVTLVRNDKYWQSGKPYLDRVELQIVDDKQSMVASVETGQQDIAQQVNIQDLSRLHDTAQVRSEITLSGDYMIAVNVTGDSVSDKRVRQALNASIDRKRITDTLFFGLTEPTALPFAKSSPAYNADLDKSITFDLNKAKALLQAAAVPAGATIRFDANGLDSLNTKVGEILQSDLAKIDLKLDVHTVENSVFQQSLSDAKFPQLFANTMGNADLTPVTFYLTTFPVRVTGNASKYTSPTYTDLVNKMQVETDAVKLKALYDQVTALMLDESFNMPYCRSPGGFVLRKSVQDFAIDPSGYVYLEGVWLNT
jgi:peptide/nickel transport system substrate-binding protein